MWANCVRDRSDLLEFASLIMASAWLPYHAMKQNWWLMRNWLRRSCVSLVSSGSVSSGVILFRLPFLWRSIVQTTLTNIYKWFTMFIKNVWCMPIIYKLCFAKLGSSSNQCDYIVLPIDVDYDLFNSRYYKLLQNGSVLSRSVNWFPAEWTDKVVAFERFVSLVF